jgi:VWFA-related protein
MNASRLVRIFLFSLSLPAFSQQQITVSPDTSRRITLEVVVTGKSEKPALNLRQQDFTVVDNKYPQKLLSFQAVEGATADPPVEIVLLMDRVNTSLQNVAIMVDQIKKFLGQNGGQLAQPVSMISFSDAGTTMQDATRDGNALITALDQTESSLRTIRRSQGIYGVAERFQLSIRELNSVTAYEEKKPGRKMLIWLSPGWPLLSGPNIELSSKDQQGLFNEIVAASTGLRQARITLYSVDPLGMSDAVGFRTTAYEEYLKGVKSPRQVHAGDLALQVLAFQSGGKVLNSSNDLVSQIANCVVDANAYYVLSFDSAPSDGPNEYHNLEVKIDQPGLKARTRTGYYAQP